MRFARSELLIIEYRAPRTSRSGLRIHSCTLDFGTSCAPTESPPTNAALIASMTSVALGVGCIGNVSGHNEYRFKGDSHRRRYRRRGRHVLRERHGINSGLLARAAFTLD